MQATRPLSRKKNLFLAFDAFGTLYTPGVPVPQAYGGAALRHGIACAHKLESGEESEDFNPVQKSFSRAYKEQSARNPNYGKATGLGAEKWWANVIKSTFQPFLKPSQKVPDALIAELLARFSTSEGYHIFPDVLPFFQMLRGVAGQKVMRPIHWKWEKTVVGIITNSDDRVPSVLESFGLKIGPRRIGSVTERSAEGILDEDISFVVLSYDVGFEKPDRRIFDAAREMFRETIAKSTDKTLSPSEDSFEKLYVGDSLRADYFGAKAAGWHALHLDRQDTGSTVDPKRIYVKEVEDGGVMKQVETCSSLEALSEWLPGDI